MKLAILIPTLAERKHFLDRLMKRLRPQADARSSEVEIYALEDTGAETTGRKRQRLIETVKADYVCHVDDDDLVAPTYVQDILDAIERGADVVGFNVRYYEDGVLCGHSIVSLTAKECGEKRQDDGFVFYTRTPNHLSPIRRDLALQIGFRDMTYGEDADYARRLYARFGATMKEVFIDKFLYDYFYRTSRVKALVKMYNDDGTMTREGMEKTIRDGGSVLVGGSICTKVEQLPMCV